AFNVGSLLRSASRSSCAVDNTPGANQPATTTKNATARKVSALGSIGHWPGSFGFSPRNCEAAPSKTEFRSTLAVFILVAMAAQVFLATATVAADAGALAAAGITAPDAACAGADGVSCGRLMVRRIAKSKR